MTLVVGIDGGWWWAGLGRVMDKSARVQVQVLEKMTSTSKRSTSVISWCK